jgi:hypothetical protein
MSDLDLTFRLLLSGTIQEGNENIFRRASRTGKAQSAKVSYELGESPVQLSGEGGNKPNKTPLTNN